MDQADLASTKTAWIALGLTGMLAGLVTLAAPGLTSVQIPELVAAALVVTGIARGVHAWPLRRWDGFAGDLALAAVHLVAAAAIVGYGRTSEADLVTIVGGWCLGVGAIGAATASAPPRVPDRGWLLGTACGSALLGIALLSGFAVTSSQTIVLVAAMNLLLNGLGALIVGVDIHGSTRSVGPSAQTFASVV